MFHTFILKRLFILFQVCLLLCVTSLVGPVLGKAFISRSLIDNILKRFTPGGSRSGRQNSGAYGAPKRPPTPAVAARPPPSNYGGGAAPAQATYGSSTAPAAPALNNYASSSGPSQSSSSSLDTYGTPSAPAVGGGSSLDSYGSPSGLATKLILFVMFSTIDDASTETN